MLLAHRYRLLARIGAGGMAVVWRARDELLGRPVALKLIADRFAEHGLHHMVHREARAAARLSHPHVATVHDYAEAVSPDGRVRPFVVMELLDGESLAARLTWGPLPWPEAAAIGAATAEALAAAHEQGVVHRDVTPGNVMLTSSGVKVVDFGISAIIGEPDEDATGVTFGTPAYVAPERLDGLPAQTATDVYALGVLLYEMVTGSRPHPAAQWEELATVRANEPAALPPGIPDGFATLVWHCLAEAPGDRPTASAAVGLLRGLAQEAHPAPGTDRIAAPATGGAPPAIEPVSCTTVDVSRPQARPVARRDIVLGAVLAVVLVFLAAVAWTVVSGLSGRGPTPWTARPALPGATAAGPTASPPAVPPPTPGDRLTPALGDAVERLRASVEDGGATGAIRSDVAQDLLNVINPLDDGNAVPDRVAGLHHKVDQRVREGGINPARAKLLHTELDQLTAAASLVPQARA
jgi:serine/threonine-protein kinase